MNQDLKQLRKTLKKQRSLLSPQQQKLMASAAVRQLQSHRVFRSARNIAIYLPVRGEIDPSLLRNHTRRGQRLYLPVLSLYKPHGLVFVEWNHKTIFRNNRFSIPEPLVKACSMKTARAMDLVVAPLLAYDNQGNRLGMGGGFYDRSFAFKLKRTHHPRPIFCGIAYQFQQVSSLQRQTWDISLDMLVSEQSMQLFNARQY